MSEQPTQPVWPPSWPPPAAPPAPIVVSKGWGISIVLVLPALSAALTAGICLGTMRQSLADMDVQVKAIVEREGKTEDKVYKLELEYTKKLDELDKAVGLLASTTAGVDRSVAEIKGALSGGYALPAKGARR